MNLISISRLLLTLIMGIYIWQPQITYSQDPRSDSWASDIAWNPDGNGLAVSGDFGVAFYDADFELTEVVIHEEIEAFEWSPNGKTLAVYSYIEGKDIFRLWDIETKTFSATIPFIDGYNWRFFWSPDSQKVAILGHGTPVYVYQIDSQTFAYILPEEASRFRDIGWSPDGQYLATVGGGNTSPNSPILLKLWNSETGMEERVIDLTEDIYFGVDRLGWHPSGDQLTLANISSTTFNLDLESQTFSRIEIIALGEPVFMGWNSDASLFMLADTGGLGRTLYVVGDEINWMQPARNDYDARREEYDFVSGEWSPDGRQLAVTIAIDHLVRGDFLLGEAYILDAQTGEIVVNLKLPLSQSDLQPELLPTPPN